MLKVPTVSVWLPKEITPAVTVTVALSERRLFPPSLMKPELTFTADAADVLSKDQVPELFNVPVPRLSVDANRGSCPLLEEEPVML